MAQETNNPYQSPTSAVEKSIEIADIVQFRKQLLPIWIKIFGWFFILAGVGIPIIAISSVVTGAPGHYSLFGLSASGSVFSPGVLFLTLLFFALGICAYGLLFGRDWGLMACIVLAYISIAICLATTIMTFMGSTGINIRLELLVLVPYVIRLHKMSGQWKRE